ncbi:MsnO8 family LLM class oxidoreductase [Streptomyces sp. NPDC002740]
MTMAQPRPARFLVSVLEMGARLPGTSAEQSVQDLVESARIADAHGYHRIWVAEHHSSQRTVSGVPAVLIAHIAALTERIRVGSGGVMLPNHPPFTVAEQFATLAALHPGRVDLGLGRSLAGPAADGLLEAALRRDPRGTADFPAHVDELLGFLRRRGPDRRRFHALRVAPAAAAPPEVHVLGASESSARIAAERGLPFAYGHHLGRSKCRRAALERYRAAFEPGPDGGRRHLVAAVNVVCAETDEEAEALALRTSALLAGPQDLSAAVRSSRLALRILEENQVVRGGPARVAAELEALAEELGVDEVMVTPYELAGPARHRTLRLTADALRATRRASARTA